MPTMFNYYQQESGCITFHRFPFCINNIQFIISMQALKWTLISEELSENGYSLIKNALTPDQCEELILFYNDDSHFRKTSSMERYRFGKGEYKYFNYPLPSIIENQ